MSTPSLFVIGNYTPQLWRATLVDPESAPAALAAVADELGVKLTGFWFALDHFDFCGVFEGSDVLTYLALRHRLFATGAFTSLEAQPVFPPDEVLQALRSADAPPIRPT